jgi:two-component system invasion response regulator UvrY
MASQNSTCALLADRHTMLAERVRDLLEADFETVYIVSDLLSLREGAKRLKPELIVLDLSLAGRAARNILRDISELSPDSRVIVLSVHDEAVVARAALASGAQSVVLKRSIGNDFLSAVSAVRRGERFVSSGFELTELPAERV